MCVCVCVCCEFQRLMQIRKIIIILELFVRKCLNFYPLYP